MSPWMPKLLYRTSDWISFQISESCLGPYVFSWCYPWHWGRQASRATNCCIWLQISDFRIMPRSMCLLLMLPIALGQTTLRGTHFKVTTVTNRPFIMPVPNLIKGERWLEESINNWPQYWFCLRYYEGFLVDMLYKLSTELGFTFTIHENPEGRCGGYVGVKWNGLFC